MGDEERLAAIRGRCEAATPGPWHWTDLEDGTIRVAFGPLDEQGMVDVARTHVREGYAACAIFPGSMEEYEGEDLANASFLAAAREDVPWLLARADDLARRVERLEAALRALVDAAALTYDGGQLRYVCPACDAVEIQGVIDHAPDCARLRAEALLAGDGGEG